MLGERSTRARWTSFAESCGGTFIKLGMFKQDRVVLPYRNWTIVLDAEFDAALHSDVTYFRAPYVTRDAFQFTLSRSNVFSGLGKMLGMQDIEIGDDAFGKAYVIKGNHESKLRALLDDESLKTGLINDRHLGLSIERKVTTLKMLDGTDAAELCLRRPGVMRDLDRLEAMLEIVRVSMDQLCRIESASEATPPVAQCPYCAHLLKDQAVCPECGRRVLG